MFKGPREEEVQCGMGSVMEGHLQAKGDGDGGKKERLEGFQKEAFHS